VQAWRMGCVVAPQAVPCRSATANVWVTGTPGGGPWCDTARRAPCKTNFSGPKTGKEAFRLCQSFSPKQVADDAGWETPPGRVGETIVAVAAPDGSVNPSYHT